MNVLHSNLRSHSDLAWHVIGMHLQLKVHVLMLIEMVDGTTAVVLVADRMVYRFFWCPKH